MAKKHTRDLPPKSPSKVKGGRLVGNDNITFVRGAQPTVNHARRKSR